MQDLRFS